MGGDERRKEYDDGRTGETVQWREKRWDEKVPEALKHTPQWALVQDYFLLESAMQRRKEEKEGMSKDKPLPKAWNIPPNEEMIPSRLLGDDYQMYDNTPQAAITRRDENVIIPETGAGKYWYVDPRAGAPQQPAQMAQSEIDHPSIEIMKAVQRMINPDPDLQLALSKMSKSEQYDPMEQLKRDAQQMKEWGEQPRPMGREDVYKTISMEIGGKEWEVPAAFDNMTDEDRSIIQYLPHTQWPKWIKDKIEDTARDNLEQGNDPFGNPLHPQLVGF